ncbi:hypothetical protein [Nostoc commune]|uniref:hypothetical protein n=1 Tax=Nostoc commune TaxID=1178 RepID=UPI0018C6FD77|nr:hypothetical protein [Nostoc commune]MBG1260280.1 hypothetical protein [Nostoc commune BAE]
MAASQPDSAATAKPRKVRLCKSVWRQYQRQAGAHPQKVGFAVINLGGFVSSSGNISTYQEVLIKKICLQFL